MHEIGNSLEKQVLSKVFQQNIENLNKPVTTEETESVDKNVPLKTTPTHTHKSICTHPRQFYNQVPSNL